MLCQICNNVYIYIERDERDARIVHDRPIYNAASQDTMQMEGLALKGFADLVLGCCFPYKSTIAVIKSTSMQPELYLILQLLTLVERINSY